MNDEKVKNGGPAKIQAWTAALLAVIAAIVTAIGLITGVFKNNFGCNRPKVDSASKIVQIPTKIDSPSAVHPSPSTSIKSDTENIVTKRRISVEPIEVTDRDLRNIQTSIPAFGATILVYWVNDKLEDGTYALKLIDKIKELGYNNIQIVDSRPPLGAVKFDFGDFTVYPVTASGSQPDATIIIHRQKDN